MTFSQIALTFSQYRGVDPGSIIFTYKGTRLYEVGSPQSLGWKDKVSLGRWDAGYIARMKGQST